MDEDETHNQQVNDYDLRKLTDRVLQQSVDRLKKSFPCLSKTMKDGGQKLKRSMQRYEDELKRRRLLHPQKHLESAHTQTVPEISSAQNQVPPNFLRCLRYHLQSPPAEKMDEDESHNQQVNDLRKLTDKELQQLADRLKKIFPCLSKTLKDGGQHLKRSMQRYEDELKRRGLLHPQKSNDAGCLKMTDFQDQNLNGVSDDLRDRAPSSSSPAPSFSTCFSSKLDRKIMNREEHPATIHFGHPYVGQVKRTHVPPVHRGGAHEDRCICQRSYPDHVMIEAISERNQLYSERNALRQQIQAANERIAALEVRERQLEQEVTREANLHFDEYMHRCRWQERFRRLRAAQRTRLASIREAVSETYGRAAVVDDISESEDGLSDRES